MKKKTKGKNKKEKRRFHSLRRKWYNNKATLRTVANFPLGAKVKGQHWPRTLCMVEDGEQQPQSDQDRAYAVVFGRPCHPFHRHAEGAWGGSRDGGEALPSLMGGPGKGVERENERRPLFRGRGIQHYPP